jgi:hypothetical protein
MHSDENDLLTPPQKKIYRFDDYAYDTHTKNNPRLK